MLFLVILLVLSLASLLWLGTLTNSGIAGINGLLFGNSNFAGVGDATGLRGSSAAGNFYLSLHTADPGTAGSQTTSEIAYTPYARVAVPRDNTILDGTVNPVTLLSAVAFAKMTAGAGGTATYAGIGTASSGAGVLIQRYALSPTIAVVNGVTPVLDAGNFNTTS